MAKDFSFDAVSDYDLAEMTNAVDQTQRELATRYDFKGTDATVEFSSGDKTGLVVTGDSPQQLRSIIDVLQGKLIKREISLKVLDLSAVPEQSGKGVRQNISFKKGLDQDKAKLITKVVRESFPKVKTQVQGDSVRVMSASKDDLQGVMTALRAKEFDFPVNFTNYR